MPAQLAPTQEPLRRKESGLTWLVRTYPLTAFFTLTYALTWGLLPLGTMLFAGPVISALVVTLWTGGLRGLAAWGRRLARWRAPWYFWVAAIAVPIGMQAITILVNLGLGAPSPSFSQFEPWYAVVLLFALRLVNPMDGPAGEEPGFRGFALPGLLATRTPLVAASILAVLVTVWHVPLVFMDQFDLQPSGLVTTVAVTFWYVWLSQRSGGLVLITLVAHAVEGVIKPSQMWTSAADVAQVNWIYAGVWIALSLALLIADRHFWTTPTTADPVITADRPSRLPSVAGATDRFHPLRLRSTVFGDISPIR